MPKQDPCGGVAGAEPPQRGAARNVPQLRWGPQRSWGVRAQGEASPFPLKFIELTLDRTCY
jgi:hypothetical protein